MPVSEYAKPIAARDSGAEARDEARRLGQTVSRQAPHGQKPEKRKQSQSIKAIWKRPWHSETRYRALVFVVDDVLAL